VRIDQAVFLKLMFLREIEFSSGDYSFTPFRRSNQVAFHMLKLQVAKSLEH